MVNSPPSLSLIHHQAWQTRPHPIARSFPLFPAPKDAANNSLTRTVQAPIIHGSQASVPVALKPHGIASKLAAPPLSS